MSWGDWLGTGYIATYLKEYRRFREARAFARSLKLKSGKQWFAFCEGKIPRLGRLPADIPVHPYQTYADRGWKGLGDWLGTGTVASNLRKYRPFREARAFVHKLKLKNQAEWRLFCQGRMAELGKPPADIPANPNQTYADKGWKGTGDWLGTGKVANQLKQYRPFREARAFARKLKLKSEAEWRLFCKGKIPRLGRLPADIPVGPSRIYAARGWKGLGDWLGTGTVASYLRKYRSFREGRAFVHKLKLKNQAEWRLFCKGRMPGLGQLPADIPANPSGTYANKGWKSMGDWLGTGTVAPFLRTYRPFREAWAFARKLKLKSAAEWGLFCKGRMPGMEKLPADMPAAPWHTYADKGWKGMGDWLGTGKVANQLKEYRPFREGRAFVHKLKLKNQAEWRLFCKGRTPGLGKLPADIPANPSGTYADKGWKGMGDWLGTGTVAPCLRTYRPFREARAFARKLKLKSRAEWRLFCKGRMPGLGKLPADIPAKPSGTYAHKGWRGMGDWLGTGRKATNRRSKN